ncbi:hypothetical protein ACVDG8_010590 [Mesorhizobium sp. ORM8.1]
MAREIGLESHQLRAAARLALQPAMALDQPLAGISARYGARATDFVTMQLEYPRTAL